MDFKESIDHTGTRRRIDIIFETDELMDLKRSENNSGIEAVEAIGKAAGSLLLNNGITGEALIVSPLYSYGFHPETCYSFLGALRSLPGLEIHRTDE